MTVPEYLRTIRDAREEIWRLRHAIVKEQEFSTQENLNLAKIEERSALIALAEAEIAILKTQQ